MMTRVSMIVTLGLCLAGGAAMAQQVNQVSLEASYLGAPTDWCPADAGVPLIINMVGPDVIKAPDGWPVQVRERRAGQLGGVVASEETTASLQRRRTATDAEVIGRFSASFRACQTPWTTPRPVGTWQVTANDGSELAAGDLGDTPVGYLTLPFFRSVGRDTEAHFAKFGERSFFTADRPNVTTSQTFVVETHKE